MSSESDEAKSTANVGDDATESMEVMLPAEGSSGGRTCTEKDEVAERREVDGRIDNDLLTFFFDPSEKNVLQSPPKHWSMTVARVTSRPLPIVDTRDCKTLRVCWR